MKKKHAEHNEWVCDHLTSIGSCNDWVVTTAFYSALHYVQHELFPLVKGKKAIASFEAYYSSIPKGHRKSKHIETQKLVYKNFRTVGGSYKRLLDNSNTARYRNYVIADSIASVARKDLIEVKKVCTKP